MTKSELIEQLTTRCKLPRGQAELIINLMFDGMSDALRQGQRIEIRGFGSFEVRDYKAYEGRNPRTGEPVKVDAKRLPFFKVGKELRERINKEYTAQLREKAAQSAPPPARAPEPVRVAPEPPTPEPMRVAPQPPPPEPMRVAPQPPTPEPMPVAPEPAPLGEEGSPAEDAPVDDPDPEHRPV